LNADGSFDPTFGGGAGRVITDVRNDFDFPQAITVQPDGKVLVTGYSYDLPNTNYDVAVVRYAKDGTLDTTWGGDGIVITQAGADEDYATDAILTADNKLVVAGYVLDGSDYDFSVLRYNLAPFIPELTTPATNAVSRSPVAVNFSLPVAATAGSVRLAFTGPAIRTLTLAASEETSGAHGFSFDPASPLAAPQIASVSGGATVPDGVYAVVLTYQDAQGNAAASPTATNVRIDTIAPTLSLPANITVTATGPDGAVVSYSASAGDPNGSGLAASSFLPASGSLFPPGVTMVNASATDHTGNHAVGSFTVTVLTAQEAWRQQYFGVTTNTGIAADTEDPDGDGWSNLFEFIAGLGPNDPTSRFILRIEPASEPPGAKAIIFSPRLSDRSYVVKHKTALTDSSWLALTSLTTSDDGAERMVIDLAPSDGSGFYIVEITRP
jgi:uncharacterized delta-60 repeat protein